MTVPSGASTRVPVGRAPGTPVWDDAPSGYRQAVAHFDEGHGTTRNLHEMLQLHDVDHTLALWHLLDNPDEDVADAALSALLILSPPPEGVTGAEIRARDPDAMQTWNAGFDWSWTRAAKVKGKLGE